MKVLFLVMGALLWTIGIPVGWAGAGNSLAVDLSQYQWQQRLLLIFPPADFPAYRAFLQQLDQKRAGVLDRDLLVFRLVNREQSRVEEAELSPADAETLRRRFGVRPDELRLVLIGKDGSVKLSAGAVDLTDIFGLIDSMPMRQREMQEKRR
jgi:hypothetical protein